MKAKINFFNVKILVLITLLLVLVLQKTSAQEEPLKIAITPFTLNAPEDMHYLKSGIQDMLGSRLSQDENVVVVSDEETAQAMEGIAEPINENEAREIGRRLSADYVLIGSLTVFGASTSLDARLVDVTDTQPTATFSEQSQKIDDLVPKINQLATDINGKIIGGSAVVALEAGTEAPASATTEDVHEHPEKLTEEPLEPEESAVIGKAATVTAGGLLSAEFWKSRTFKRNPHGLDLGDVDNDGKIETVVITANTVLIYRNDKGRLFKIGEIKGKMNDIFVGVDVGDINNNGYAEIFVSGLNPQRTNVNSFVLEYDGKEYRKIVKGSPWNYRIVKYTENPPILLGQKNRTNKPYTGDVFTMRWRNKTYDTAEPILSKTGFNLLGLTYGNVIDSQQYQFVAYDDHDTLRLMQASGMTEWQSDEKLGGSTLSWTRPSPEKGGNYEIQYLPMRISLMDIDADGINEVLAVKNYDIAGGHMDQFRHYTKSEFIALSWNGLGLTREWATDIIPGFIRDYALGDFDNDGKNELVAAVIHKEGKVIATKPKSHIIAFDLVGQ